MKAFNRLLRWLEPTAGTRPTRRSRGGTSSISPTYLRATAAAPQPYASREELECGRQAAMTPPPAASYPDAAETAATSTFISMSRSAARSICFAVEPLERRRLHEANPSSQREAHQRSCASTGAPSTRRAQNASRVVVDDARHLGVRPDAAAQERLVRLAVLDDVVEVRVEARAQALERIARRAVAGALEELRGRLAHRGDVEVLLGREVVVEQALRDAGRLRPARRSTPRRTSAR